MSKKYVFFAKILIIIIIFGCVNFYSIAVVSSWLDCMYGGGRKCINLNMVPGEIVFLPVMYTMKLLNFGQDKYSLASAHIHYTVLFFNLIAYFLTRLIFRKIDKYQSRNTET